MSAMVPTRHATSSDGRPRHCLRFLFLVSTLSVALGRNGYYLVAAWALVERGYGSAGVATFLAIVSLVEVISSPIAGVMTDRFDRRRLNAAANLGLFAVVLATALALLYVDMLLALCLSAALFSLCDRTALTAGQSLIPATGAGRRPAAWNAAVFLVMQAGSLGATLSAGYLLDARPPSLPFAIYSAFFLLSAGVLASMRMPPASASAPLANTAAWRLEPGFAQLIAVYALFYASALLVSVMGPSLVFAEQKGTGADFAYLEAAWSAGSLLGTIALMAIHRPTRAHARHLLLLGVTALVFMAFPLLQPPWATVLFVSLGFLYNLGRVSVEVTFQSLVAADSLGRAKGMMHTAAVVLSLAVFGVVAGVGERAFPSTIFFSFGVVLLICIPALALGLGQPQEKGKS